MTRAVRFVAVEAIIGASKGQVSRPAARWWRWIMEWFRR
jgi:hypothetical protein